MQFRLVTAESVTEGHPDKLCDRIADSILDEFIRQDPQSRVAVETIVSDKIVFIAGEVASRAVVDVARIARGVISSTGYTDERYGMDGNTCIVMTNINLQSADIAAGVNTALEYRTGRRMDADSLGAGDQGMMYGYACKETASYLPLPIFLAHKLVKRLDQARKTAVLPYLRPDGKAQVTVEYDGSGQPSRLDTIVIAAQHDESVSYEQLCKAILTEVIEPVFPKDLSRNGLKIHINPSGRFVIGGPKADTGLTGRKIMVDTYGGLARHGGGAFSGKDPTKVDRSAAYMARYAAKNLVAAGFAGQCEVSLAYAIGMAYPVSVHVNTFNTGKLSEGQMNEFVKGYFDFRPGAIIEQLNLLRPIYRNTAVYGHFGREEEAFTWERLDKAQELMAALAKERNR